MDWLELHIDTTHTGLEPVETMLSALGIDGVVIDDETEFHDFLESNRQYWDYVDQELMDRMRGVTRVKVLRHRRRGRPGPAGAVHTWPGRGVHRHPPDGQRLGVQLAEVL